MSLKKTILFVLITFMTGNGLFAQTVSPRASIILNLDYSRFRYDNQSSFLEIYYGFHPKQISYNFTDGKYRGGILLSTTIRKTGSNEIVIEEKSPLEITETDTSGAWYKGPFVSQAGYAIPNGEYFLEVTASDLIEPSRRDSITLDFIITSYGSDLAVSDIELCKKLARSDQKDNLFYKNALEVVPAPSLVFGVATVPVVFHYTEIYNVTPGVTYNLKTEVLNSNDEQVRESTNQRHFNFDSSIEVGTTPIAAYPSGKYVFRLTILDENLKELIKTDKTFYIFNPLTQMTQQKYVMERTNFKGLTEQDLDEEFECGKFVATGEEKKVFKQLNTVEGKITFLVEFWTKVARGRGDLPPIIRSEYLERAELATERYTAFRKKGWKTDRGIVLMKYGDPDEVERIPSDGQTKPYEMWRYYGIESGVVFYFIDKLGYGLYELVHSTKRGELRDENWAQYLR